LVGHEIMQVFGLPELAGHQRILPLLPRSCGNGFWHAADRRPDIDNNDGVRALARIVVPVIAAAAVLVPAAPAVAATYTPPALRQRVDLNTGWKFTKGDVANAQSPAFDDSAWATV